MELIKKETLHLAAMVVDATNKAIIALVDRRTGLAETVMRSDDEIDRKEVQIEEECLKALALHQPVAADLRFIISVIKANNDLERIGDLAVNIAERAAYLSRHAPLPIALDFPGMAEAARKMLLSSLEAFSRRDAALARKVLAMDDGVDDANREMYLSLQSLMHGNPETIERAIHLLSASRHLERIGDLATNIAEDVVYMVEGELIRHQTEDFEDEA